MSPNIWLHGARPRTLATAAATVLVGVSLGTFQTIMLRSRCVAGAGIGCSIHDSATLPAPIPSTSRIVNDLPIVEPGPQVGSVRYWAIAVSCLLVALALQVCANYLNDYSDGVRGSDTHRSSQAPTRLVASGVPAKSVATAALIAFGIACVTGNSVVILTGRWLLLAIGLLCALAVWGYTSGAHPYGYAGYGELVVFLVYGPLGVWGTAYALTGLHPTTIWEWMLCFVCGLPTGFAAAMVLLANNMRDIDSDAAAGKRTLAVRLGPAKSMRLYVGLLLASLVVVLAQTVLLALLYSAIGARAGVSAFSLFAVFIPFSFLPQFVKQRQWKKVFQYTLIFVAVLALVMVSNLLDATVILW